MGNPRVECRFTEMRQTDALVENRKNPNKHPLKQLEKIARVIELNGWRAPIVVSARSGFIVKGHGRLMAAKLKRWTQVPVEIQAYENEAMEYADMVADNALSSYSELDKEMLDAGLIEFGTDLNIDATGLDAPDLEACSDEELEKPMKPKVCPHCGGAL